MTSSQISDSTKRTNKQTFLRRIPLFSNLSEENILHLIHIAADMRLSAGVYLFEEGSVGRYFFVIEQGEIEVFTHSGDTELLLAVRKPGEIIGELSLLDKSPRMASARARVESRLLVIPREAFDRFILRNPSAARDMLYTVIPRWRHTETIIREREQEIYTQSKQLEDVLKELKQTNDELEQRVATRTAELEESNARLRAYIEAREDSIREIYRRAQYAHSTSAPVQQAHTDLSGRTPPMNEQVSATYQHVIVETDEDEKVATITMNRPDRRNALSFEHMNELLQCITALGQRADVAAIIIRGNGPVFCSGHDLRELVGKESTFYRSLFDLCVRLMEHIQAIPQPVIAQVHGVATAAGCQLVASCDLAVAADDARFATPGVKIGLFCSTPMVAISRAIHPKKAMEMLLTGDMLSATDACEAGLVNRVVPASELETETRALAHKICSASAMVVGLGKRTFYQQLGMTQQQAYAYTREAMALNASFADTQEGITAFLEKRPPRWRT